MTVRATTLKASSAAGGKGGSTAALGNYPQKALKRSLKLAAERKQVERELAGAQEQEATAERALVENESPYGSDRALLEEAVEVARERVAEAEHVAGYYGDGQEAEWYGPGAERLGLEGVPTAAQLTATFEGRNPTTGEQLGYKYGDKSARGFDTTFSVQKEVSVLRAIADAPTRVIIDQAVLDAAKAVLDDVVIAGATTRMRRDANGERLSADGSPTEVPAEAPAIALVPEFTSRKGDPQGHVHAIVSAKVYEPTTGKFYALEARNLKMNQQAMSAKFHIGLEAELSDKLGVAWGTREQRFARSVDGLDPELLDAFSSRTADIKQMRESDLQKFRDANGDAMPTPQQKYRMDRAAVLRSRPAKSEELQDFDSWRQTAFDVTGKTPEQLIAETTGKPPTTIEPMPPHLISGAVIGDLTDTKSSFTRGDLIASIGRHHSFNPKITTATQAVADLNATADKILDKVGIEVTPEGTANAVRRFSTSEVINQEIDLLNYADAATVEEVPGNELVEVFAPSYLDPLQLNMAGRFASDSDLEIAQGIAGTGKTTALEVVVETIEEIEGPNRVIGVGPSSASAEALRSTGMRADNINKFLIEHLDKDGPPAAAFQLERGGRLIVDEAGMVSTPHLKALTDLAAVNGWKVRLVGDPLQFSAVGRGGMFEHLLNTLPEHRITHLETVHRFEADWEGEASKQLRAGKTEVLDVYAGHGRIHAYNGLQDLVDSAAGMYLDVRDTGREVAVFTNTNELVAKINTEIQNWRVLEKELTTPTPDTITIPGGGQLYLGDQIETRRNDRNLITTNGEHVKNRDRWTITGATETGITIEGKAGTVTLPADYVAEHVNLGYAQTNNGSQGRTVDGTGIEVVDPESGFTDRRGLYVGMSRGKHENHVLVNAPNLDAAKAHLKDAMARNWVDAPAISHLEDNELAFPIPDTTPPPSQPDNQPSLFDNPPQPEPETPSAPEPLDPRLLDPAWAAQRLKEFTAFASQVESAPTVVELSQNQFDSLKAHDKELRATYTQKRATYDELLDNPPSPLRSFKKYQAQVVQLEGELESLTTEINDNTPILKRHRATIKQFKDLATNGPEQVHTQRQEMTAERATLGWWLTQDPATIETLGPVPADPAAHQTWFTAAGARHQYNMIRTTPPQELGIEDYEYQPLVRTARKVATHTATELGNHIGHQHVPAIQPPTPKGPSLGL